MALSTTNFYPVPISPKFCITNSTILLKTHCFRHHRCTVCYNFLHTFGTGSTWPKTTFTAKINRGPAKSENSWQS